MFEDAGHMRDTKRHEAYFDKHSYRTATTVIGCGGTGGKIVQGLVELGVGLHSPLDLYDGGVVKKHNLVNQVYGSYGTRFVDQKKMDALRECVPLWGGSIVHLNTRYHPLHITGHVPLSGIVFLCVDTRADRMSIAEKCLWDNKDVVAVIETRMNPRYCSVNLLNPNNPNHVTSWKKTWPAATLREEVNLCDASHAIGATSSITASLALSAFIKIAAYLKRPAAWHLVPNQIEIDLSAFRLWTRFWE